MQIAIVIDDFDADRGGAGSWTCHFAVDLLTRGYRVHVLAQQFSAVALHWPIIPHRLPRNLGRLALAAEAERCLSRLNVDVVHDMGVGWSCDIFHSHDGSRLAQRRRKLLAFPAKLRPLARCLQRMLPRYREFDQLAARQFDSRERMFVALSDMVANDYQRLHHVPAEQIRLVYNGVDTRRFSPQNREKHAVAVRRELGVSAGETLALFVGHDFRRKGLATAVRAVAELAAAGAPLRLAVVGGKHRPGDASGRPAHPASGPVMYVGFVHDPVPYYAAADIFVLPSLYDPCSLSVLEAAASGLPSITTRANGAGELLTHARDGFVLDDPTDHEELAAHLKLLLDPVVRGAMGRAARATALRHTMRRNTAQIVDLYHEIAERRSYKAPLLRRQA